MKKVFISVLGLLFVLSALGQSAPKPKKGQAAWLIKASAAYQFPEGDLSERFGENFSVGVGTGYKTASNWIFSFDAQFMFGENVKDVDQLLSPVLTSENRIFNDIGNYADFAVLQRGVYASIDAGKTLGFLNANANSGPHLSLGAGYIAHWIGISSSGNNTPQITGEYAKGYDELTGGILLKQSLGYIYMSRNRRVNFRVSFELMEAFTNNLRGFSYSTGKTVNESRLDLIYGLRLEWMLPIYSKGSRSQEYFYD